VKYTLENFDNIESIILLGGYTFRKSMPRRPESLVMGEWLLAHPDLKGHHSFFERLRLESDSYTTYENIQKASEIFARRDKDDRENEQKLANHAIFRVQPYRIVIFCEATRSANVMMLARHFMLPFVESIDDITVETASWERADPFLQVGNLIYNKLALRFPFLARWERRRRIKKSENR
jgi:hypothetical protein